MQPPPRKYPPESGAPSRLGLSPSDHRRAMMEKKLAVRRCLRRLSRQGEGRKAVNFARTATASPAARRGLLPGGPLPGYPLIVLERRLGLGERVAPKVIEGVDGLLTGVFVPLWRSPGGGDSGRGSGLADRLQDGPYVHRLGNKGDDPHIGPALRAGQRKNSPGANFRASPPGRG